jgi:tetratricopeptide (TPR) repeat protein
LGRTEEVIDHYREALRLKPTYAEAHSNLASTLLGLGRSEEAIDHYREALRLNPAYAAAHHNLASCLVGLGRIPEAIEHYQQALQAMPDFPEAWDGLARLLATQAPEAGGNPAQAVQLAERACALTEHQQANFLDTLAMAYAAADRFPEAIAAAEQAIHWAQTTGQAELAGNIQSRLELYRAGRPYRESPRSPGQSVP